MRFAHTTFVLALSLALLGFAPLDFAPRESHAAPDPTPVGDWEGEMEIPGYGSLTFVMHVEPGEDGGLTVTLDSPDQGDYGIPTGSVTYEAGTLTVDVPQLNGSYEGKVGEDAIDGTWSQNGRAFPLVLEPINPPDPRR